METDAPRVNQADIARALGISQSTVSIALKGDVRVSKKTRALIQRQADEMGYVPDPSLLALSRYRRHIKESQVATGLAWVTNWKTADGWQTKMIGAYHRGARARAAKLGYQLYDFWLADPGVSKERFRQILVARGIRGLLFPPQQTFHTDIDFDFSGFAGVKFGYSLRSPNLHMVSNYQHQTVRLAYRSLEALGYERIGFLMHDAIDRRVDRNFSGGYHSLNPTGMDPNFIQPFVFNEFSGEGFNQWFTRWRPDAVIVTGNATQQLQEWLAARGMTCGEDLAIAELNLNTESREIAGIDQQSELIGRAAVDVLDSLLSHFEYDLPANPMNTLVPGVWRDGQSAPGKSPRKGRRRSKPEGKENAPASRRKRGR